MAMLTKEDILGALDLEAIEFPVSEWGGSVKLRGVSLGERTRMLESMKDDHGDISTEKASLVAFTYGVMEPAFSTTDYDALRKKNAGVIDRIVVEIMKLSGFSLQLMAQIERGF